MSGFGDINQDGRLDGEDLALLRTIIQGNPAILASLSPEEKSILDVNGDGQINPDDINTLCARLLNSSSPIGTQAQTDLSRLRDKLRP